MVELGFEPGRLARVCAFSHYTELRAWFCPLGKFFIVISNNKREQGTVSLLLSMPHMPPWSLGVLLTFKGEQESLVTLCMRIIAL